MGWPGAGRLARVSLVWGNVAAVSMAAVCVWRARTVAASTDTPPGSWTQPEREEFVCPQMGKVSAQIKRRDRIRGSITPQPRFRGDPKDPCRAVSPDLSILYTLSLVQAGAAEKTNGSTVLDSLGHRRVHCAVSDSGKLLHRAHGRSRGDHALRQVPSRRRAGIELEAAVLRFRGRPCEPPPESRHAVHGDQNP